MGAAGIPCGPIHDVGQVCNDVQVAARNMIIELEHPVAGRQKMPNTPLKFSQTPIDLQEPAPLLGQHTEQVLGEWLGLSVEELEALRAEGTI